MPPPPSCGDFDVTLGTAQESLGFRPLWRNSSLGPGFTSSLLSGHPGRLLLEHLLPLRCTVGHVEPPALTNHEWRTARGKRVFHILCDVGSEP